MKLTATREDILAPLQSVIGVVERRQTMPVLANVLLVRARQPPEHHRHGSGSGARRDELRVACSSAGDITVPGSQAARYLSSACRRRRASRSAPRASAFRSAAAAAASRSRRLPAAEFPLVEEINAQQTLTVAQGEFRRLIDKTHFSMAQQDVRYYLNGTAARDRGQVTARGGDRRASAGPCETELAGTGQDRPAGHRAAQGRAGAAADPR